MCIAWRRTILVSHPSPRLSARETMADNQVKLAAEVGNPHDVSTRCPPWTQNDTNTLMDSPTQFVRTIVQRLEHVAPKWRHLGLHLEIEKGKLEDIEAMSQLGADPLRCMEKVVEEWYRKQQAREWETIAIAVHSLQEHKLARGIREEYYGITRAYGRVSKRKLHLKWDDYFMAVALLSQELSQIGEGIKGGACIVDQQGKLLSTGYATLCCDQECHAEINAILMGRSSTDLRGCVMYTTRFPCNKCAQYIIQSGIQKVIYAATADEEDSKKMEVSMKLLDSAHVCYKKYNSWAVSTAMMSGDTTEEKKTVVHIDLSKTPLAIMDYDQPTKVERLTPKEHKIECLQHSEYFMAMAFLSTLRCKDPHRQVGACITKQAGDEPRIVGIGCNSLPDGCSDNDFPWQKSAKMKDYYICHAEMNAIMNRTCGDLRGATLYTTLSPCKECTKLIMQAGIEEVVYAEIYHESNREYMYQQITKGCSLKVAREFTSSYKVDINLSQGFVAIQHSNNS